MKSYKFFVLGLGFAVLSITFAVRTSHSVHAQGNTPKEPLPVQVFQAAGPNAASIQSVVGRGPDPRSSA